MVTDPCGVCGGSLAAEPERRTVSADIPMGSDECRFEPQETDPFVCANDGWLRIEHDAYSEGQEVHLSCYLDHDDILSPDEG